MTVAIILASNAPDIDIVATSGGAATYFQWHRGPTHGAAGVLGLSGTVTATALAVVPASAARSAVVVVSCAGHGIVRPGGYDIGCTANELLRTLHWQTWRGTAYGNGVLKVNACTPASTSIIRS